MLQLDYVNKRRYNVEWQETFCRYWRSYGCCSNYRASILYPVYNEVKNSFFLSYLIQNCSRNKTIRGIFQYEIGLECALYTKPVKKTILATTATIIAPVTIENICFPGVIFTHSIQIVCFHCI